MKQTKLIAITLSWVLTYTWAIFVSLSVVSAATSAANTLPARKRKPTRAAYRAELDKQLQDNKVPCKFSPDCEAVALGAKPCGGPSEYLILNKATRLKMQDAFSDLTKTITEMEQAENAGKELLGVCTVLEKPEVTCIEGACRAAGGR